jgi:hypothetical protein
MDENSLLKLARQTAGGGGIHARHVSAYARRILECPAYDNLNAKLDVIEKWPALYKQTQQEIASESYLSRRWGDVKDIGFREIAANQQDDIKKGQQAIEEMKRSGLLPPEVEDKAIQAYVNSVAQRIAQKSDLKIPLHVSVLQSREINAFALPGGYLFIERGLLEAADDESELAGVLAHEMAHDAARHANKLMKRATIAGIFYQAPQVAAIILTGDMAGIGTYYAFAVWLLRPWSGAQSQPFGRKPRLRTRSRSAWGAICLERRL